MLKIVARKEHPFTKGYIVTLSDGTSWSVVDVGERLTHEAWIKECYANWKYEAMLIEGDINKDDWTVVDPRITGSSFDEVFNQLEQE